MDDVAGAGAGAGVAATVIDRRARTLNRVAIVAGALTGKANLAGAGLIAMFFSVQVRDRRHLAHVMRGLKRVTGVRRVQRART